jgi:hypothetical protein
MKSIEICTTHFLSFAVFNGYLYFQKTRMLRNMFKNSWKFWIVCLFWFHLADFPIFPPTLALQQPRTFWIHLSCHYTDVISSPAKDANCKTWTCEKQIFIRLFMLQSVLRQVHSLFQSEFSTECDLVPISSIPSFPQGHLVAAYILFLVFPSLLSSP